MSIHRDHPHKIRLYRTINLHNGRLIIEGLIDQFKVKRYNANTNVMKKILHRQLTGSKIWYMCPDCPTIFNDINEITLDVNKYNKHKWAHRTTLYSIYKSYFKEYAVSEEEFSTYYVQTNISAETLYTVLCTNYPYCIQYSDKNKQYRLLNRLYQPLGSNINLPFNCIPLSDNKTIFLYENQSQMYKPKREHIIKYHEDLYKWMTYLKNYKRLI